MKIILYLFFCLIFAGCSEKNSPEQQKAIFEYSNWPIQKTSIKYQSNVRLDIKDGELPDLQDIKFIFEQIKNENNTYKNYFMNFYIEDKISLFRLSKIGNEEIKIVNSWSSIVFNNELKIQSRYSKVAGFIKYSDVYLKEEDTIEDLYSRMGKTIFKNEGALSYLVFNKIGEFIAEIIVEHEAGKVKEIDFSFGEILEDEEKEKIVSYFFGERDLVVKRFENRNGINIQAKNAVLEFDTAKRRRGYIGPVIQAEISKNTEVINFAEESGFETNIYIKKDKVYKIEVLQTGEIIQDNYKEFIEQIAIICSMATDDTLGLEVYNIIKKLDLSYENFSNKKKYKEGLESGYLRYVFINDEKFNRFQIENTD